MATQCCINQMRKLRGQAKTVDPFTSSGISILVNGYEPVYAELRRVD
jgi:hypothetical protein